MDDVFFIFRPEYKDPERVTVEGIEAGEEEKPTRISGAYPLWLHPHYMTWIG